MSSQPYRIQRKRTKGSTLPPDAVYVGRPTKFGNPFTTTPDDTPEDRAEIVRRYRDWLTHPNRHALVADVKSELRGKNLACWCRAGEPCHADVLLEIANS